MTNVEKLIATAQSQIGYLEKASNSQLDDFTSNAGSNNYTKFARDLDALGVYNGNKNGYAWCDVFVDWCFYATFGLDMMVALLCQPLGGAGAGCTYSAQYFKNKGRFYTSNPQAGDQIFFTSDGGATSYHTGLVYKVDSTTVYTIEGNTSSDAGVVENGGAVAAKSYSLSYYKIMGYGRPDWSLVPETEEEEMITLEQFQALLAEHRSTLQDNDSNEYSQQAREWAVAQGIVSGGSTTEFNGMWEDFMTREQFVTVLYRFAVLMGKV